jgi:hypothetical protein
MRQPAHKNIVIVILTACLLMLVVGMLLPIEPTLAQRDRPQRTVVPPAGGSGNTPSLQITPPAGQGQNSLPDFAATVEALTALSGLNPEALQATAQAVINNIPALEGEFSTEDLSAWVESLSTMGSISFDADRGAITFTMQLDESTVNSLVAEALAGYEASSVTVDFANGAVVISASGITLENGMSGTLAMTVQVTAVNGQVVVSMMGATINGQNVPAAVLNEMEAAIQAAFSAMPAETPFEYSIDQITITDTAIIVTATIVLPVGG